MSSVLPFPMTAIAAMARNRVIGRGGAIPWHLPEDFRWFKRTTSGHVVVMGRRTFESLGRPLPNRENVVLSRGGSVEGVTTLRDLRELPLPPPGQRVFLIGGAEIYARYLPECTEVLLTVLPGDVEGDTYMPEFEHLFPPAEIVMETAEFRVWRYAKQ